jgi:hypothetical protein
VGESGRSTTEFNRTIRSSERAPAGTPSGDADVPGGWLPSLTLAFATDMNPPIVYDKAKYHTESVAQAGLKEGQEFVHTGMFLGWLIDHDLLEARFAAEWAEDVAAFRARKLTGPKLFQRWDGVLVDDMLSDRGNAFSKVYFDFEKGAFIADYQRAFGVSGGNDFFGVSDSWENYEKIKLLVDSAYERWTRKQGKKPWEFWK